MDRNLHLLFKVSCVPLDGDKGVIRAADMNITFVKGVILSGTREHPIKHLDSTTYSQAVDSEVMNTRDALRGWVQ